MQGVPEGGKNRVSSPRIYQEIDRFTCHLNQPWARLGLRGSPSLGIVNLHQRREVPRRGEGRKCPFGSSDLSPVMLGPKLPGTITRPMSQLFAKRARLCQELGVWALVGPVALITAFEAGSWQWLLGTHLLSCGWPQGCYQRLGVSLKEVSPEFGFLFKPCLVAGFGGFLSGVINLKGHFYQVSEGSLRPILSLGEVFFFFNI